MIQLFDYVGLVFSSDHNAWEELKSTDKSRNFFMLNRFMAIQFPVQASFLSHYKIDPVSVSDYWHRSLSSKFKSTPKWIYAKTVKKKDQEKKLNLPSPEMITWWCNKHEISKADFNLQAEFFGENFLGEVRSLEKILKSQGALA